MTIDFELWIKAEDDTQYRRSQVQGLLYHRPHRESNAGLHMVRDCWVSGNQVIWQKRGTHEQYDALHEEADAVIRRKNVELVFERYLLLIGEVAA